MQQYMQVDRQIRALIKEGKGRRHRWRNLVGVGRTEYRVRAGEPCGQPGGQGVPAKRRTGPLLTSFNRRREESRRPPFRVNSSHAYIKKLVPKDENCPWCRDGRVKEQIIPGM